MKKNITPLLSRIYLVMLISFFAIYDVSAQVIEMVDQINENLAPIETDKEIISQECLRGGDRPYNVELIRTIEKVKDGKIKTYSSLLNLALLNENKVVIKSSKNKMLLKMETSGGKYIQRYEDKKSKGYTNVLEIQYGDIDEARLAEEMWKKLILSAKERWANDINLPSSLGDLKSWMQPYVGTVDMGKHEAIQTMTESAMYDDYLNYEISNQGGKDKSQIYRFSLGDIEEKSLKVSPSGSVMKLDVKSKRNKKLFLREDEKGITFHNKMNIYFSNAGSALEMAKGMEVVVAMAQEVAEARVGSYENCDDCLGDFSESVNTFNREKLSTNIEGDCQSLLMITKGNKSENYLFRWSDLDITRIKEDFGTNELKLTLETRDKKKFITKAEDGEVKGYQSKLDFYFNNLETFRKSGRQVLNIIESCELDLQPENVEWMDNLFSSQSINKMDQSISTEDECSVVFTSGQADGDKSFTYEFNLYDLDPKRLSMKISKSKLQLDLNTNNKEKIITKTNQDGKLEYANKITLDFDSLDNLRKAELTFIQLIGGCTEG